MDTRYYEHLKYSYDITWNDISDKEEKTLLETQMKVAKMMTESTNRKINNEKKEATLNETAIYLNTLPQNSYVPYSGKRKISICN